MTRRAGRGRPSGASLPAASAMRRSQDPRSRARDAPRITPPALPPPGPNSVSATRDRGDSRPEPRLLPAALGELRVRSLEREGELVEALCQLRPEELHERRFRARLLAALEPRQRAPVEEPHDLDVDPASRDL